MPTLVHEVLVELFRNRPAIALELLQLAARIDLSGATARIGSVDLSEATPTELRCDALIEVYEQSAGAADDSVAPRAVIVVEVQRSRDDRKLRSWPAYVAVAAARFQCPVYLFVLATSPEVTRWAARSIPLGHPGFVLTPIVLGLDGVPRVTNANVARTAPELAVLSALAHPDAETAEAALLGMADLPEDQQKLYWDLILIALPAAARHALETTMLKNYEYQSDFARKYYSQGREEGREEGRTAERVAMLCELLTAKFGPLSAETEARIAAASYEQLGEITKRVLVADGIDAVFADQ